MFVIGETKTQVNFSKLDLPKEYHLRKRSKTIYGGWLGDRVLYLSDEQEALRGKIGKTGIVQKLNIDSNSRIGVPSSLDKKQATIKGCISTIKIEFEK